MGAELRSRRTLSRLRLRGAAGPTVWSYASVLSPGNVPRCHAVRKCESDFSAIYAIVVLTNAVIGDVVTSLTTRATTR